MTSLKLKRISCGRLCQRRTYSYCAFNMWYCFTIHFFSSMPSHFTKVSCCSGWCWILIEAMAAGIGGDKHNENPTIQTFFLFSREQDNAHVRFSYTNMVEPLFASPSLLRQKKCAHILESLPNLVSHLRPPSIQGHQLCLLFTARIQVLSISQRQRHISLLVVMQLERGFYLGI